MSTAIEYSSQQGPKFNQRLLKGKLLEKQENLNLFIDNVLYGVDLTILSDKVIRSDGGSLAIPVPTVVQAIRAPPTPWAVSLLPHLQSSEPAIIYGPLTIAEGVYNGYYRDIQQMTADIIPILQREILTLAANGVNHIRIVENAMSSAILSNEAFLEAKENIKIMFAGCPSHIKKEVDFGNCDIDTSDLEELEINQS